MHKLLEIQSETSQYHTPNKRPKIHNCFAPKRSTEEYIYLIQSSSITRVHKFWKVLKSDLTPTIYNLIMTLPKFYKFMTKQQQSFIISLNDNQFTLFQKTDNISLDSKIHAIVLIDFTMLENRQNKIKNKIELHF